MQVSFRKINLWRICRTDPSPLNCAHSGHCLWKEMTSHQPGVHLVPQPSSPLLPSAASPQGPLWKLTENNNIGNSWSGCASNICPMIQTLVVIPRTILQTNVLNYLFPGTSSREWPGAALPNMLATSSQAGSSATQVKPCPRTLTELPARPPFHRDAGRTERAARTGPWPAGTMHGGGPGSAQAAAGHPAGAGPGGLQSQALCRGARGRELCSFWWHPTGRASLQVLTVSRVCSRVIPGTWQCLVIKPLPTGNFPHSGVWSGSHNHHT